MNNSRWIIIFLVAVVATFGLGFLIASIGERRAENLRPTQVMVTPIGDWETDPKVWGRNFPREYQTWLKTRDSGKEDAGQGPGRTKWGGSDGHDKLARFPHLKELFAGYGFAKEYNRKRGHAFAVEDVKASKRINDKTPSTCYTCKSPDVPKLMHEMGVAEFYKTPFKDLASKVQHPISCLDCHDPKTMDLTITRPAFVEAMNRRGIDVNKATHQEMRSYVCAQCHVEYYFKGDGKYLTFPWDKAPKHRGVSVDDIAAYYQESGFTDWVHPLSKTPMIKIQHPDYELWSNGVHAYRGVSCADCHMPYKTEGGVKVTDHQVKSPLLGNIAVSCQVCHRWSENEIRTRVESIQDKTMELMDKAEIAIIAAHNGVAECLKLGFTDDELKPARTLIREAQLRWDFIAAENSTGFHAPQEAARILGIAIDQGRQAELLALGLRLKKAGGAPVAASDPGK